MKDTPAAAAEATKADAPGAASAAPSSTSAPAQASTKDAPASSRASPEGASEPKSLSDAPESNDNEDAKVYNCFSGSKNQILP